MSDLVKRIFKQTSLRGGLVSGHRQVIKALESGRAKVVFLASDCDEASYTSLMRALAKKHNVALCNKFSRAELGEIAGQVRKLSDGKITKSIKASSCAITNFGTISEEDQTAFAAAI